MDTVFIVLQYILPQHLLSRLVGKLAECQIPWIKNPLIRSFISHYGVNMSEAQNPHSDSYEHFNAFFTRALKEGARPICTDSSSLACPADGAISQLGRIHSGRILQAKGQTYSCRELLGGDEATAEPYSSGSFATVYLSPKDYHRVHMPLAGTLKSMTYIPGDLFSVNQTTADNVPRLFARNERLVAHFDTEAGPMAVILVGAMIVAGIETVWAGQVTPFRREIRTTLYPQMTDAIKLDKGEEMGRFKLGSTVILLFGKDATEFEGSLHEGKSVRMGERFGEVKSH